MVHGFRDQVFAQHGSEPGAAIAAATGIGWFDDLAEAADAMRGEVDRFDPCMEDGVRRERLERWERALAAA